MPGQRLVVEDLGLTAEELEPLDVLDLPQIHTLPPTSSLLDTLALLGVEPRSWESTPPLTPGSRTPKSRSGTATPQSIVKRRVRPAGVPQYLTGIISSPLAWIDTDEEREQVWDAASVRLSERSGRTGMGALRRTFRIPVDVEAEQDQNKNATDILAGNEADEDDSIEIEIHEPALTEDNLGLKTWASSYVFARKWPQLKALVSACCGQRGDEGRRPMLLELGAGTGLVGIAAAAVLGSHVLLTDLPDIVMNLERNANVNRAIAHSRGGSTATAVLDWTRPLDIEYLGQSELPTKEEESDGTLFGTTKEIARGKSLAIPIIVAADPVYTTDQPKLLAQAVDRHLLRSGKARVIIVIPIREAFSGERNDFLAQFRSIGLDLVKEETEVGFDDWSTGTSEDLAEVECWMTIWAWRTDRI